MTNYVICAKRIKDCFGEMLPEGFVKNEYLGSDSGMMGSGYPVFLSYGNSTIKRFTSIDQADAYWNKMRCYVLDIDKYDKDSISIEKEVITLTHIGRLL